MRTLNKLIVVIALILFPLSAINAKHFAWICAVEQTDNNPDWIFVYEDVKQLQDGCYRVFIKWEFTEEPDKSMATQAWLISSDFDKIQIVKSTGYDKQGKLVYSEDYPYGEKWSYVMPDTYCESIVETAKGILLKK